MHSPADETNQQLKGTIINTLLSRTGRGLYFPKGIVAQAQEAARRPLRFNATAGIACENRQPLMLPSLRSLLEALTPGESVDYAPTGGDPQLRRLWRRLLEEKNPGLEGMTFSLPLVTSGVTHALSLAADLFIDPGDVLVSARPAWENYELVLGVKRGAAVKFFPLFTRDEKFNLPELQRLLSPGSRRRKIALLLNFPHNPTGYALSTGETAALIDIIHTAARRGRKLLILVDDAYFGLFFEEGLSRRSLFAELAALHENVLACKLDGATKEDFVWGFRIGFLTFSSPGLADSHYQALEAKGLAAIRTSVSSSSRPAQSLLLRLLNDQTYREEKERAFQTLLRRYRKVKALLSGLSSPRLHPLPFNAGYFLTFRTNGLDAGALREYLLREKGTGVIAFGPELLRVSYASVDEEDLEELFQEIFSAAAALSE